MKFYGRTDIGLKRRNNQDSYAVFARDGYVCAIVCDGMGGAKGGNVASGTAVKAFASVIRKTFAQKNAAEADARTVKALLRSAADAAARAFAPFSAAQGHASSSFAHASSCARKTGFAIVSLI